MEKIILERLKKVSGKERVHLEFPEKDVHGDFATNIALVTAKKKGKDPKKVAKKLVEKLERDKKLSELVSKIEVKGPGFINFFLKNTALADELGKILKKGSLYGAFNIGKGRAVVIDYSSPNIAKRFSIGHLRSTTIGQALYNLHSFLGYKVIGDNHLGDWGTQFGMIIAQIKRKDLDVDNLTVDDLEDLYVEFNREMKKKPELKDKARKWFYKLEKGDSQARKIWQKTYDISIAEFNRIYELLGIDIDYTYGESFYEDKMQPVIDEARQKGVVKKSKGAQIIEFDNIAPGLLVKSDGATTYLTRDLATMKYRIEKWNPKKIIYEVGAEQKLYFEQVFKAAEALGWKNQREFVHMAHGLMRFEHGKMSTRKGETVKLEDVLKEAIERARKIIDTSETGRGLSKKEKEEVSKKVGIGAVKYFDLMHKPQSDIVFNWEDIFVLEGNSAPYLQYTFARTKSVLAKCTKDVEKKPKSSVDLNKEERSVARSLSQFSGAIFDATKNYSPNLLANYLFDLAQKFNTFYNKRRILDSDNENFRVLLTAATGQVLKNGLTLLGIEAPEKM